jgi:tetratricopeptide (TPR) repeat protein
MKWSYLLLAILVASASFCQGNISNRVESQGDTAQVHALLQQSKALQWIDSYGSLSYADQALTLARNIDYPRGMAVANTLRGFCFWSFGDNDLAIEAALEALDYGQAEKDIFIEAESYYILARGYMDLNERSKAHEYIDQA